MPERPGGEAMIDKDMVLPLVINPIGQRPVSALAQRDADWPKVQALITALEWALQEGSWRLAYCAQNYLPDILKVSEIGQVIKIDWEALTRVTAEEERL